MFFYLFYGGYIFEGYFFRALNFIFFSYNICVFTLSMRFYSNAFDNWLFLQNQLIEAVSSSPRHSFHSQFCHDQSENVLRYVPFFLEEPGVFNDDDSSPTCYLCSTILTHHQSVNWVHWLSIVFVCFVMLVLIDLANSEILSIRFLWTVSLDDYFKKVVMKTFGPFECGSLKTNTVHEKFGKGQTGIVWTCWAVNCTTWNHKGGKSRNRGIEPIDQTKRKHSEYDKNSPTITKIEHYPEYFIIVSLKSITIPGENTLLPVNEFSLTATLVLQDFCSCRLILSVPSGGNSMKPIPLSLWSLTGNVRHWICRWSRKLSIFCSLRRDRLVSTIISAEHLGGFCRKINLNDGHRDRRGAVFWEMEDRKSLDLVPENKFSGYFPNLGSSKP